MTPSAPPSTLRRRGEGRKRPLRLLAFSHSASFGGSEQLLLHLVRELTIEQEVSCTVIAPAEGPLTEALRAEGVETRVWSTGRWCRSDPVEAVSARRILAAGAAEVVGRLAEARALDADAVLSMTTVIPWGGLIAALLDKPHLWYVTDFGDATRPAPHYLLPFEDVRRALQAGADRPLVVSRAVRDRLFADASSPPTVVYPHLPPPSPHRLARQAPRPGVTALTVFGAARPAKGHWDAVEAVAELARRGLEVELAVVGNAEESAKPLREHARKHGVEDRLRIVGHVADQHPWMASSDIVLVPSHDETFSLVCLEALLHSKPLVATRVGGIVEFVEDGQHGLTVRPGDPAALAAAVERLIRDPDLGRRLAVAGHAQVVERFTADRFSGEVRRMLDEVVAAGRRCAVPDAIVAPLEALATEHHVLHRAWEHRKTRFARQSEEADLTARKVDELKAELAIEREGRQAAETQARELSASLDEISGTRAFRLVQTYWRMAGRLRRRRRRRLTGPGVVGPRPGGESEPGPR